MLVILITLTSISALCLIVGFVWMLSTMGQTVTRSGDEVGAGMMAEQMAAGEGGATPQLSAFKGKAVASRREADISFRDVWRLVAAREWGKVLPVLLLFGGLMGFLLFGALALFAGMENKWVGGFLVVMALYILVRTLLAFVKA